jgi:hypothetical protein
MWLTREVGELRVMVNIRERVQMKKFLIASVLATTILVAQVQAQSLTIAFYAFNTNGYTGTLVPLDAAGTNYVETANIGSGISSFSNFNTAGTPLTILSSVTGNPNNHGFVSGNSISQNNWDGSGYFQFTLDSTGYQNIVLSWTANVSSTGPANTTLRYSTTGVGGTFTDFATFATPKNTAVTQDLSLVTALNNNSTVVFRLVGVNASNTASGTMKIDNFAIEAIAIPEPSTVFLVGMSLAGLLAIRRRRS